MIWVTGAHVVVGALTLGATVALSVQIRYHVVPKARTRFHGGSCRGSEV